MGKKEVVKKEEDGMSGVLLIQADKKEGVVLGLLHD